MVTYGLIMYMSSEGCARKVRVFSRPITRAKSDGSRVKHSSGDFAGGIEQQ